LKDKPGALLVDCSAGLALSVPEAPTAPFEPATTVEVTKPLLGATPDAITGPEVGSAEGEGTFGVSDGAIVLSLLSLLSPGLLLLLLGADDVGGVGVGAVFAALDAGCLADVDVGAIRVLELVAATGVVGATRLLEIVAAAEDAGAALVVDERSGGFADETPLG
jgi:hypothetical protein